MTLIRNFTLTILILHDDKRHIFVSNWQKTYQTYVVSQFVKKIYWTLEKLFEFISVQISPVTRSCPSLCNPMDCSMPGFPVHLQLGSLLKLMSIELVMPSSHLILCCPLLLLPSIICSIMVFSRSQFFAPGGQSLDSHFEFIQSFRLETNLC